MMKTPTTPYSIAMQEKIQINKEFLTSQGWILDEEFPLFETFKHSKNKSAICSIGLYGSFSLTELHWLNQTPERSFFTNNSDLTTEDYFTIVSLLKITL